MREHVLRFFQIEERLVGARFLKSGPHRLDRGIAMGRLDRGGGLPLEDLDERAVGGAHQIRRAVRDQALLPQDRQGVLQHVPKQPLLPHFRSIRRDDEDSHASTRPRNCGTTAKRLWWTRPNRYPLSTFVGSVNFFRTALSPAASLRIPSMSFSRAPRHFRSAASPWVAYKRAAVCSDSNRPSFSEATSSRPRSATSFIFPSRSRNATTEGTRLRSIRASSLHWICRERRSSSRIALSHDHASSNAPRIRRESP